MKKSVIIVLAVFLLIALVVISIVYYNPIKEEKPYISDDKPPEKPYYPRLTFAIELLKRLQKYEPNKSISYSPHSLYETLLLAYFTAVNKTEKNLKNILGLNWVGNKSDIESTKSKEKEFNRFENQLIEFNSVNKLYVTTQLQIRESVKNLVNDNNIESLNFHEDPEQCTIYINHFIEEATKNQIKNLIPEGKIERGTSFVMVNAVYFKGKWATPFDRVLTKQKVFYKEDGNEVYVDMMEQPRSETLKFEYGFIKNLDTQILKMPYKGDNGTISMFIFLPAESTSIDQLLDKLTAEVLDNVFNGSSTYSTKVEIYFPKISLEKEAKFVPIMLGMGVNNLFSGANFSDLFEDYWKNFKDGIKTDLMHKAKIEIDEEGSTAAAGTALWNYESRSTHNIFQCNHPFVFVIHDKKLNEILFAGTYHGPN